MVLAVIKGVVVLAGPKHLVDMYIVNVWALWRELAPGPRRMDNKIRPTCHLAYLSNSIIDSDPR